MALIKDGVTSSLLAVEASGAARSVLYGPTGAPITAAAPLAVREASSDQGPSYTVNFDLLPVTALADGTLYFALHNPGPANVYIRRITFGQGFVGTNAASRSTFRIERYTMTGAIGAGNTAIARKDPDAAPSVCLATSSNSGITATGITYEAGGFYRASCPNQVTSGLAQNIDVGTREAATIQLRTGQGLAIRASGAIVAGAFLVGSIGWHER